MKPLSRLLPLRLVSLFAALFIACVPVNAQAIVYRGNAQVVDVDLELLSLLGIPLLQANIDAGVTGDLPPGGGVRIAPPVLSIAGDGLLVSVNSQTITASTVGVGTQSFGFATVNQTQLSLLQGLGKVLNLSADILTAHSSATCGDDGSVDLDGSSVLVGLTINALGIEITGELNQHINVEVLGYDPNLLEIIANKQVTNVTADGGSITQTALEINIFKPKSLLSKVLTGSVVISRAYSGVDDCPQPPNPCDPTKEVCGPICPDPTNPECDLNCDVKDFVTGGGFVGTGSSRVNFGMVGGYRNNGSLFGHLNVKDHGTGLHIIGAPTTAYSAPDAVNDPNTRDLEYDCSGTLGVCQVRVTDNGEPGNARSGKGTDFWSLAGNSYYREGNPITGGNLQLHKRKGCDVPLPPPDDGGSSDGGSTDGGSTDGGTKGKGGGKKGGGGSTDDGTGGGGNGKGGKKK